jgi:hypothetical protein
MDTSTDAAVPNPFRQPLACVTSSLYPPTTSPLQSGPDYRIAAQVESAFGERLGLLVRGL